MNRYVPMKRTCSQQRRIEGCSTANAFSCAADLDCGVIFYSLDQYTRRWVFIADERLFDQVSRGLREEEKYICAFSHAMIALGYRMGRWTEIGFQSHRWKQGKMNCRLSTATCSRQGSTWKSFEHFQIHGSIFAFRYLFFVSHTQKIEKKRQQQTDEFVLFSEEVNMLMQLAKWKNRCRRTWHEERNPSRRSGRNRKVWRERERKRLCTYV